MIKDKLYTCDPYKNNITAAYITAINILAVEFLIKTDNPEEYSKRIEQLHSLDDFDLECLYVTLQLNRHTSSLGAMITQNDYDGQRDDLFNILDGNENWVYGN